MIWRRYSQWPQTYFPGLFGSIGATRSGAAAGGGVASVPPLGDSVLPPLPLAGGLLGGAGRRRIVRRLLCKRHWFCLVVQPGQAMLATVQRCTAGRAEFQRRAGGWFAAGGALARRLDIHQVAALGAQFRPCRSAAAARAGQRPIRRPSLSWVLSCLDNYHGNIVLMELAA